MRSQQIIDSLISLIWSNISSSPEAVKSAYDKVFRTETGRKLFRDMFALIGGTAG